MAECQTTWIALPAPIAAHWFPPGQPDREVRIHAVAPGLESHAALCVLLEGADPGRPGYRQPGGGFIYARLSDLMVDEP